MSKQQTTTKKLKVVGQKDYIDATTGELHSMNVSTLEEKDFNFYKVWMSTLLSQLDEMTNKKTKVAFYLIENMNKSNNLIVVNQSELSKKLDISRPTISEAFKILLKHDFMRKINNNVYQVNANSIASGSKTKRDFLLIQYSELDNEENAKYRRVEKLKTNRKDELLRLERKNYIKLLGQEEESPITLKMSDTELINLIIKEEFKDAYK